ncbi:hypothetical protein [Paenibacillus sp. 19GGS1-52]|uniref:hypothetical protein n=1 Tax=Paenibacillus sp. 19GGS1-52 TaxID=2758563 RepID=UPI001EFC182A|nr:hypothetical protein [Paenibacillus sp. 19GGS1-52]
MEVSSCYNKCKSIGEETILSIKLEYDITAYQESLYSLSQLTNQNEREIEEYIILNLQDYSANHYLEEFNIDERSLLEKDLWLTSLHVTTNNDDCASLKKYGLMDIQKAISLVTQFYQYLKQFGITFDLVQKKFTHKNKTYDLSKKFNAFSTDDKEQQLETLERKLYKDNQINGFYSYDNMLTYGGYVNRRPEFLCNLAEFLDIPNLLYDWERNNKCYVIKFIAPISEYTDWNFMNSWEIDSLDDEEIEIKKRKWMMNVTLSNIIDGFFHQSIRENYSYLRPNVIIPYSNFTELYTDDEYLKAYGYERSKKYQ